MELNLILFGLVCTLVGIIYATLTTKINKLEVKQENLHENLVPKVQKLEDIQGTKIDLVSSQMNEQKKSIETLTEKVNTLAHNFHSSKNIEGQLNQTMTAILKHLEKVETK
jgi:outer membrane murein-binding lipoprotein Lpp